MHIDKLTIEDVRKLIGQGDDKFHNSLRILNDGTVVLHQLDYSERPFDYTTKGNKGVKIRFETYCAHNSYVGMEAAEDDHHVKSVFKDLKIAWDKFKDSKTDVYIDLPVEMM